MKKVLFVVFVLFVLSNAGFAKQKFGVVAGTNVEKMIHKNKDYMKNNYPLGYSIGLYGEQDLISNFFVRLEILKNKSINKFEFYTIDGEIERYKYKKDYFSILMMIEKSFCDILCIQSGLQVNHYNKIILDYREILSEKNPNIRTDITYLVPKVEYFFCLGIGKYFELNSKDFNINLRLLKLINEIEYTRAVVGHDWKNYQFQFLLSMQLF